MNEETGGETTVGQPEVPPALPDSERVPKNAHEVAVGTDAQQFERTIKATEDASKWRRGLAIAAFCASIIVGPGAVIYESLTLPNLESLKSVPLESLMAIALLSRALVAAVLVAFSYALLTAADKLSTPLWLEALKKAAEPEKPPRRALSGLAPETLKQSIDLTKHVMDKSTEIVSAITKKS